jgi:hypothetical protein
MGDLAMTTTMPAGLGARRATAADARPQSDSPGRASTGERGAFEAALGRQAQAARSGDTGVGNTGRPGRAGRETSAGRPVEHGAADREAAEADSAGRPRAACVLPRDPGPRPFPRRGLDDEQQAPTPLLPEAPAPLSATLPPPTWVAAMKAPDPAPRTLAAEAPPATAARRTMLAELAASPPAGPQRWQVELTEPALPVRAVAIERTAAGPLTLIVSTTQPVSDHQADKLRRLLAARGAQPQLRGAADPHDEEFLR